MLGNFGKNIGNFLDNTSNFIFENAGKYADYKNKLAEIEIKKDKVQPLPGGQYYYQPSAYDKSTGAQPSFYGAGGGVGGSLMSNLPLILAGVGLVFLLVSKD